MSRYFVVVVIPKVIPKWRKYCRKDGKQKRKGGKGGKKIRSLEMKKLTWRSRLSRYKILNFPICLKPRKMYLLEKDVSKKKLPVVILLTSGSSVRQESPRHLRELLAEHCRAAAVSAAGWDRRNACL